MVGEQTSLWERKKMLYFWKRIIKRLTDFQRSSVAEKIHVSFRIFAQQWDGSRKSRFNRWKTTAYWHIFYGNYNYSWPIIQFQEGRGGGGGGGKMICLQILFVDQTSVLILFLYVSDGFRKSFADCEQIFCALIWSYNCVIFCKLCHTSPQYEMVRS